MNTMKILVSRVFTIGILLQQSVTAYAKPIDLTILSSDGQVSFVAKTKPVPLTIEGIGNGLTGKLKIIDASHIEGDVSFPLKTLTTKLATRDEHMQKYLDSEHFPTAKFVVTLLPWSDPSEALVKAVEAAPFEGKMTLHGVEKPIKGTMSSKLEAQGKVNFTFVFELNIVDFGIAVPSYLGVTLKEVVGVTVNSSAKLEAL